MMKHLPAFILLIPAVLVGCSRLSREPQPGSPATISVHNEEMPAQEDSPMESIPDDGQGIIYI